MMWYHTKVVVLSFMENSYFSVFISYIYQISLLQLATI